MHWSNVKKSLFHFIKLKIKSSLRLVWSLVSHIEMFKVHMYKWGMFFEPSLYNCTENFK